MKFLTEEWFAEFKPFVLDTFSAGKTPSKVTLTLCEHYSKVPQEGGQKVWLFYNFKDGVVTECSRGIGEASAPDADYTTDADYDVVVKLMTGEMASAKALLKGQVKLKGNVTKALKLIATHDVVDECKKLNGKTEY